LDRQIPFNGHLLKKYYIAVVQTSGCMLYGSHGSQVTKGVLSLESNKGSMKSNSSKQNLQKRHRTNYFFQQARLLKTNLPPAVTEQVLIILVTK